MVFCKGRDNAKHVDISIAKYGIRLCDDYNGYYRARYAANPEVRARQHERSHAAYLKKKALKAGLPVKE